MFFVPAAEMDGAKNRYDFEGRYRIRNILIFGAGPSGLLFLQYLRNVRKFDGEIGVAGMREKKLAISENSGGSRWIMGRAAPVVETENRTGGSGSTA